MIAGQRVVQVHEAPGFLPIYKRLISQATTGLQIVPRYSSREGITKQDLGKEETAGFMTSLAEAGSVTGDLEQPIRLSQLAQRMGISVAFLDNREKGDPPIELGEHDVLIPASLDRKSEDIQNDIRSWLTGQVLKIG